MDFQLENGAWRSQACLRNQDIVVRVKSPALRPAASKEQIATEALAAVESRWTELEQALLQQAHQVYLRSWVPEGQAPVDSAAFLGAIRVKALTVDIEDETLASQFLYFDDSDLFGGHGIEVFVDGFDGSISVDIVG